MPKILFIVIWCSLVVCIGCEKSDTLTTITPTAAPVAGPTQLTQPASTSYLRAQRIEKPWLSLFEISPQAFNRNHHGIRSYEIAVEYPQIHRARTGAELRFNRWIKNKVMGYVREFRQLERRAETQDRKRKLQPANITEGLRLSYTIYYSDSRLISFRLTHSVMAIGQTHPVDYYETINYDLPTGAPLRQSEVFKRGYLRVFSDYSRKHLQDYYAKDFRTDEWLSAGTRPRRVNFPNWNVVPDGILIAFEDYQIASHSFGQLELIVPYSELKAVLRAKSTVLTNKSFDKLIYNRGKKK